MQSIADLIKEYNPAPFKPISRYQLLSYFSFKLKEGGQDMDWKALASFFAGIKTDSLRMIQSICNAEAKNWSALFWEEAKKARTAVPRIKKPKQTKLF